jgi:hypothetical protein
MPHPEEASNLAIEYLEKALQKISPQKSPVLLKALAEAHMWRNVISKNNDFSYATKICKEAIDLCESKDEYFEILRSLKSTLSFFQKSNLSPDKEFSDLTIEILDLSPTDSFERFGYQKLFYNCIQAIKATMLSDP